MAEKKKNKKKGKRKRKNVSKIVVNFYRTKIHGATMGFKKELGYEAKSRQFTKGFDIVGEVSFNGNKGSQIVAINTKKWEDTSQGGKRLLIRSFTKMEDEKGGNFKGGIELSVLESINVSHIAKRSLPVFIMVIPGFEYLTRISKMKTLKGKKFFFPILPDDDIKHVRFIRLVSKVGFGDDFNVFEGEEKIAEIDDKKMDIGGKFQIKIISELYKSDKIFHQMIILVASMLKFLGDCEDDINSMLDKISSDKDIESFKYIPDSQELMLFKNPRRMK